MIHKLKMARLSYERLEDNEAHQFAARHALKLHSRSDGVTIYTFIPKNACTTLRYSLAIANGCIQGPQDFDWIHKNNWVFSASTSELVSASRSFVVLRCPFARLASFYLDKVVSGYPPATQLKNIIPHHTEISNLTFRDFVCAMETRIIRKANNHWRNQSDFLVFENYTDYFALETLKTNLSRLEKLTGMAVYDARELSRHGTDQFTLITEGRFCDTRASKIAELKRSGRLPAAHTLFDAEITASVSESFNDDLQLYKSRFGSDDLMFQ